MIFFPNAKINLGLHILEKRSDGYHNIETLFYPLRELCDVIEIHESDHTEIRIHNSTLDIPLEQNLIFKAYQLFANQLPPLRFDLLKNIPHGAGLGGGSADAAFVLKHLNEKFHLGYSSDELAAKVAPLGADCAFFIHNQPMLGTEKGNVLCPIALELSNYWIAVYKPEFSISTAQAYQSVKPRIPIHSISEVVNRPIHEWKDFLHNDFEASLYPQFPALEDIKKIHYDCGAIYSSLSGSGSAVYGIYTEKVDLPWSQVYWSKG